MEWKEVLAPIAIGMDLDLSYLMVSYRQMSLLYP
jgi:hypothetical protein